MATDIKQIGQLVQEKSEFVRTLLAELDKTVVGQRYMLEPVWNVSMQDMRPCTNSSKPVGQRYRCVLLL